MARLRAPSTGCAWDLAQTFETIAPYAIEEAYEVADAIARGDLFDLRDELGDLLLQVVFHARMAEEKGVFDLGDVVAAINAKLVRRHPHIFGDSLDLTPDQVKAQWDTIKAQEKAARAAERRVADHTPQSVLDKVAAGLSPLMRALRLQAAAATVGFDWPDIGPVLGKVREETDEVEGALAEGALPALVRDEIGDLLFSVVNLARHAGVNPDEAILEANAKFARRFRSVETALVQEGKSVVQEGKSVGTATLREMDDHWHEAKRRER